MEDYKNEISFAKKTIYWIIGLSLLGSTVGFFLTKAKQATHIKNAVHNNRNDVKS